MPGSDVMAPSTGELDDAALWVHADQCHRLECHVGCVGPGALPNEVRRHKEKAPFPTDAAGSGTHDRATAGISRGMVSPANTRARPAGGETGPVPILDCRRLPARGISQRRRLHENASRCRVVRIDKPWFAARSTLGWDGHLTDRMVDHRRAE